MNKTVSFKDKLIGPYTEEQINADWNSPKRIMGAPDGRTEIVVDPLDSSRNVLEVKYPKGRVGQEVDGGGAQWRLRFDKGYYKATAEYEVMFPVGFDFVKGGKLPGLCGGTSPAGGKKSDGTDGFSAQIMWRESGELFQYMYWMERDAEKKWGDNFSCNKKIVPGKWHRLRTEIMMNTLGERDGKVTSWLDGELALEINGAFRALGATFEIDSFNFTTFFGGNTPDWAPSKDEVVYFGDFKIVGE